MSAAEGPAFTTSAAAAQHELRHDDLRRDRGVTSDQLDERRSMRSMIRSPGDREVAPLELLFDLVFVLGVSQLARYLVATPSWSGAAETAVLYIPIFAVWAYTSWAATLYSLSHHAPSGW